MSRKFLLLPFFLVALFCLVSLGAMLLLPSPDVTPSEYVELSGEVAYKEVSQLATILQLK